jgi:glycosyltransferase involved in cell wall biosynthesis
MKLITLYKQSNFFLLPTRAEASGLVFSEAAAFGLPVVTTDTGGITSIVRQGVNGITLPYSATAISYAKLIEEIFNDPSRYKHLAKAARQQYDETLNWDTWGNKVNQLIDSIFN